MWFSKKPFIVLAPMADMTDSPFCRVCREVTRSVIPSERSESRDPSQFVIFREMVSAEAIVRENKKTLKMCEFDLIEKPIVLQLFGSSPEIIRRAAEKILEKRSLTPTQVGVRDCVCDGIDINMGCPVPKITKKGLAGAALMKEHERACAIVKALKNANLGLPISVKTRLGWSKKEEILEFAPKLEQAGADAVTIHGRTKTQGYSGKADWEMIGRAVKSVSIPVIANGDIASADDIKRCLEVTCAAGVMIGRGALGNPWILSGYTDNPDLRMIKNVVLRHARLHLEHYGEEFGLKTFRKHLLLYFKGMPNVKEARAKLAKVETMSDLQKILRDIEKYYRPMHVFYTAFPPVIC